jgi:vitamin-K-epoxide reductase (warfarin-sensitive)
MRYLIALLALAGVVVSALALQVHYSTATEPCDINAKWDCGIVNHSPFAEIMHIPVAAIGIAGYLRWRAGARQAAALLAGLAAGRAGLLALPHLHREVRAGGLLHLLRHLAGDHRADDDASAWVGV